MRLSILLLLHVFLISIPVHLLPVKWVLNPWFRNLLEGDKPIVELVGLIALIFAREYLESLTVQSVPKIIAIVYISLYIAFLANLIDKSQLWI